MGGGGADIFEFERGDGDDRIGDFQDGQDQLQLDDLSRAQIEDIIASARQVGDDLVLTLSPDTTVTIEGLRASALSFDDFAL